MPNMASIIKGHNRRILNAPDATKPCNCRDKKLCPLDGDCQAKSVVYEAQVESRSGRNKYIGLFKLRFNNHMSSLMVIEAEE